jgi:hypothetical protein
VSKKDVLKKQSQFLQSKMNVSINKKGDYEEFHVLKAAKSQSKPISSVKSAFANDARDCHGPSGLAVTSKSLLLCALVVLWL